MHIARSIFAISLLLFTLSFTLLNVPMTTSAAPSEECYADSNACIVYEVCNDHHRCRVIVCDAYDTHCNQDASERGGVIIDWSFDDHEEYHNWAWYQQNEVVVRLNLGENESLHDLIEEVERDYNLEFVEKIYREAEIILYQTSEDGWSVAEALAEDARVLYAEPNVVGESPKATRGNAIWLWGESSTEQTDEQKYTDDLLQLDEAHAISTGDNVTVAIIDTGIDHFHPWFGEGRIVEGYDFVDDDYWPQEELNTTFTPPTIHEDGTVVQSESADDSLNGMYGHGTHVSGIVAQVAPDAKIMPLRALDSTGVGNIVPVAEAILHAAEHCADVINLSMGTPFSSELLKHVVEIVTEADAPIRDRCERKPLTIVAAAGNEGTTTPYYPAAYPNVLAVTSNDENSEVVVDAANFGDWVTLAAPGENIYSAVPYGIDNHDNLIHFPDFHGCMYNDVCDFLMILMQVEQMPAPTVNEIVNNCTSADPIHQQDSDHPIFNGQCDFWSGTSMAAPFVAGSAALVSSLTDSSNIAGHLAATAQPLVGEAVVENGVVSPLQALQTLDSIAPSQPPLQVAVRDVGVTAAVDGIVVALVGAFGLMIVTGAIKKMNVRVRPRLVR